MIIWNGLGFLIVIFLMGFGFLFYELDPKAWETSDKPFGYGLILTGIVSGILGYFLRRRPERTFVDKATGEEVTFRPSHSLFFIPMVYWGPIFIIWGLFLLIRGR